MRYLKVMACLLAGYLLFAAGAYVMPQRAVERHVVKSLERGDLASDQPRAVLPRVQCRMDNYTDALILNQAVEMRSMNLVDGTLLLPRLTCERLPFEELRVAVGMDTVAEGETRTATYARYWHGNTFLTRYLLCFLDYPTLRLWLYIVSSLLMLWCGALLWRRGGWQLATAVGVGLLCCYVFVMQFSVQLAMVLLIALGGMIAVAKGKKSGMVFFVVGSLTAYFDLLTTPMLTLGLPLVVALTLRDDNKVPGGLRQLTLMSALWGAGYGITWVAKWLIASLLTSEQVLADGIHNVANRSSVLDDHSRWEALTSNMDLLPWSIIVIALAVMAVTACLRWRRGGVPNWGKSVPLLAVALIPWLWYLFTANHSYLHNWFTYRAQAVSIAALLLAAGQFITHTPKEEKT